MTPPAAPGEAPANTSDASETSETSRSEGSLATNATSPLPPNPVGAERSERVVLDDESIRRALKRIAHEIVESADGTDRIYLVAIPNGGVPLGRLLADNLENLTGERPPLGILDTTLYRDDLSTRGSRPPLRRTEMPSSVDGRVVVLVEDVVNTGRTIRAGMDALMDFGRPSHVRVVALVDRGHRELPIKIDYVGKNIPTQPTDKVVFRAEFERAAETGTELQDEDGPTRLGALELSVLEGDTRGAAGAGDSDEGESR